MTTAAIAEPVRPSFRMWTARPLRHESPVVRRPALVQRLADPMAPPLAVLVAPAGYGKTTLLREWAKRDASPFAWVTVDEGDNDGRRLRDAVEVAIDRAVGGDTEAAFVLVIDDAQTLYRRSGLDALAAIANDLPPHARLAVASRRELALPVARFRAERLVTEIGPRELAMSKSEAARLLADAGHRLDPDTLDALLRRTEGWPVALALAALYLGDGGSRPNLARFGGADRLVADYVRDEVLGVVPASVRSFAVQTCVADTLTGPLCDALLARGGSAAVLGALARDGLVIPMDRTGERYRYHRLVRDTLRMELRRRDPELEPELHRRASEWHRSEGDVDRALFHALAAGDARVAGDLVWRNVAAQVADGQTAVVERWLSRFSDFQIARQPRLALAAAGCALARGQGHLVEHWAVSAADAPQPAGSRGTVDAGIALLRAAVGAGGPARMREDAHAARALLHPGSGACGALASFLEGVANHLLGDVDAAAARFEEGARDAAVRAPHVHALCLSELAVLALERSDWDEVTELTTRARGQADRHGLRNAPASALVFAVSALARAHRGRIEEAQADLQEATRLQGMLTDFAPWYGAQVRILLARTALRLSDVRLARTHVTEAERLLRHVPEAVALASWLGETQAGIDTFTPRASAQLTPMTAAELRVLRFLPTHLSFREIAERTQVSANTVKTQANAVYRKFGVACRSDAVTRARSCGLLD
jgi:LuxR family transcriptional regulator, maltose regulon positive regulatory protein